MGLRETIGGMAEDALNKAIDKALGQGDLVEKVIDMIRPELKKLIGEGLAEKIKANWIDQIDGEDDIPDV